MKRFLVLFLFCSLLLVGPSMAIEGTQVKTFKDGTRVEIPELAPSLLIRFDPSDVIVYDRFDNGKGLVFSGYEPSDSHIRISFVWVVTEWPIGEAPIGENVHLVAIAVKYGEKDWEYLVDQEFLKSGRPTDKLVWWYPTNKPSLNLFRDVLLRTQI